MSSIRKLITSIASLALVFSAGLSTAAPPDHSKGNPPQKFYMSDYGGPFTYTFDFIHCGDFGTTMTLTVDGFWIYHPPKKNKSGWEFYHSDWPVTITNASNTAYFVDGIPGQVMNRHWTGEPWASDPIETGVQLMVTLPGHGVILRDVGRIRYDFMTFEAKFMAGHWDTWDGDFQALCEALRP